jgi:hypothetical protein
VSPVGSTNDAAGKKPDEVVWVVTAHVVEGQKQPAPSEDGSRKAAAPSGSPKK